MTREEEEALVGWLVKEKAGQAVFRMRITERYEISDSINGEIITDWRTQGMDAKTDGRRAAKDFSWIVNTDHSLYRLGPTLHFKPLPGAFANCGQSNKRDGQTLGGGDCRRRRRGGEKKRFFLRGNMEIRGGNTFAHRLVSRWKERSRFVRKGIDRINLIISVVFDREMCVFYNYNIWWEIVNVSKFILYTEFIRFKWHKCSTSFDVITRHAF